MRRKYISRLVILAMLITIFAGVLVFTRFTNDPKTVDISFGTLSGDCNNSGSVDILDFQLLSNSFGKSTGQTGFNTNCDFNGSGSIDILDFQILSNNFGRTGTTNTPTPSGPAPTSGNVNLRPFGTISLSASDIKFNVNGAGSNVDSIAFWEAPDPTQSLMFVTAKGNSSAEVYKYPFTTQLRTVSCGSSSNGVWVDQERDILFITQPRTNNVCAYNLPTLTQNSSLSFATNSTISSIEPNITMLNLSGSQKRIYVSYDTKVYIHDAANGNPLGVFTPARGLETMYGDNYYQRIYIPDEGGRSGVYIYDANGNTAGTKFGDSTIFDSDEEGIWVYKCPSTGTSDNGEGLIIVTDQKSDITDFEFFNRKTKAHLGKLNISGVNNTDGISITQQSSPLYPKGLFAAIDNDTSTVGVGWDTILSRTGLSCGI